MHVSAHCTWQHFGCRTNEYCLSLLLVSTSSLLSLILTHFPVFRTWDIRITYPSLAGPHSRVLHSLPSLPDSKRPIDCFHHTSTPTLCPILAVSLHVSFVPRGPIRHNLYVVTHAICMHDAPLPSPTHTLTTCLVEYYRNTCRRTPDLVRTVWV